MKKIIIPGYKGNNIAGYLDSDKNLTYLYKLVSNESRNNVNIFILIDKKIFDFFNGFVQKLGKIKKCHIISINATEKNKSIDTVNKIISKILSKNPSKNDLIINIGGGIILNIGGFVSGIILRGMRFIQVPTTLCSCTDVIIGGKQAVNFNGYKNQIGMYNDPVSFYINTAFLDTINNSELKIQLIEGLKLCITCDKNLFWKIFNNLDKIKFKGSDLNNLIKKIIYLKCPLVRIDPYEQKSGLALLYGHTIGHAIEMLSNQRISHCEAIGLGMLLASKISFEIGICDAHTIKVHEQLLEKLNITAKIPSYIKVSDIIKHIKHDKKKYNGKVRFILVTEIGRIFKGNNKFYKYVSGSIIEKVLLNNC